MARFLLCALFLFCVESLFLVRQVGYLGFVTRDVMGLPRRERVLCFEIVVEVDGCPPAFDKTIKISSVGVWGIHPCPRQTPLHLDLTTTFNTRGKQQGKATEQWLNTYLFLVFVTDPPSPMRLNGHFLHIINIVRTGLPAPILHLNQKKPRRDQTVSHLLDLAKSQGRCSTYRPAAHAMWQALQREPP